MIQERRKNTVGIRGGNRALVLQRRGRGRGKGKKGRRNEDQKEKKKMDSLIEQNAKIA